MLWIAGFILILMVPLFAQEKVKNLILMIPDGTSTSVLSIARWYRFGACPDGRCSLAVDPWICGLVTTHNSDSPFGDSAPTGSAYSTGYLSTTGFVATYPVSSGKEKDLVEVDPARAYQPLITILEASRLEGKSTGLIVTCQFPHATPAGFASHTPDRNNLEFIAKQIVHNKVNLVFGGGLQYLDPTIRMDRIDLFNVLRTRNYQVVTTLPQFRALSPQDTMVYGLFADNYLPYERQRNPMEVPSLAEMTRKAIQILSTDPNGFFLMVEGSKIDWAAHLNDAAGVVAEYLAFDDAVKEAVSFANRDGYTAVVICPDHGCGGITLGNSRSDSIYDTIGVNSVRTLAFTGFTTHGHTGEDVFLAAYHPMKYQPSGVVDSREINHYLRRILDLPDLDSLTKSLYSADTLALAGIAWELADTGTLTPRLIIRPHGKKNFRFEITSGTDYLSVIHRNNVEEILPLPSLALYVAPLGHFYIPRDLKKFLLEQSVEGR